MTYRILTSVVVLTGLVQIAFGQWTQQSTGISNYLRDVHFVNASKGWAVGGGIILKTNDGGNTWNIQKTDSIGFFSVHFIDSTTGWVAGHSGVILHTTDGGNNWNSQPTGTGDIFRSVHFIDNNNGWAVGGRRVFSKTAIIYNTSDGGNTWNAQYSYSSTVLTFFDVHFENSSEGWAIGGTDNGGGTIYHTTDGGSNWSNQTAPTEILRSGHFVDASEGWVVGNNGMIAHTTDGGSNWNTQVSGVSNPLFSVHFIDSSNGWAVGGNGVIVHTDDGGATWNTQSSGTSDSLWGIDALSLCRAWSCGDYGTMLSANGITSDSIASSACYNYTVPSGDETYVSSGTYMDTLTNSAGCDSLITIDLSIDTSSSSLNVSSCSSYTVPSGDTTYTSSGVYVDTLTNSAGCDSVLTINLTVNDSSSSSINETACNDYTVPSGDETYTSSGTYEDTIPNDAGCDSIISIDLLVNNVDTSVTEINPTTLEAVATGASYQWLDCNNGYAPISGETYQQYDASSNGSYGVEVTENGCADTSGCHAITGAGCSDTYVSITDTACNDYTVPSGDETYTTSGNYEDTIPNDAGCDSIISIDLTVSAVDTSVNPVDPTTLEAVETGASYQWLDCDNGYSALSGETYQQFTASSNGNYSVEVTKNGCVDTSGCHEITDAGTGIAENDLNTNISFHPNPTDGRVTVEILERNEPLQVTVRDMNGKKVSERKVKKPTQFKVELGEEPGIYMVRLRDAEGKDAVIRVMKK